MNDTTGDIKADSMVAIGLDVLDPFLYATGKPGIFSIRPIIGFDLFDGKLAIWKGPSLFRKCWATAFSVGLHRTVKGT